MPTVRQEGPYRLFFFSNENNEPPHVHVEEGDNLVKFWLEPVSLARNHGFADHKLTRIQSLVQKYQTECLRKWDEHFSSQ